MHRTRRALVLVRRLVGSLVPVLLLAGCGPTPVPDPGSLSGDDEEGELYVPYEGGGKADSFAAGPLTFSAACRPGSRVVIAAVGDVLLHGRLQQQAFREPSRYVSLFAGVVDLLGRATVAYANLEGPLAAGVSSAGVDVPDPGPVFDGVVYSSYPSFNYHPTLAADLVSGGVDVVSTANNHALDRLRLGVDRTVDALDAARLPFTGTRRSGESGRPWHTMTDLGGLRLAWLACTYATNGIRDLHGQVLRCDDPSLPSLVRELSERSEVDAVIVTPHWGVEYHATPSSSQVDLAHRFLEAGALAVLGSHPHVVQPWEKYVTADGRETFVIYSLGNFVSGQLHLPRRSTLLLYLGLTRFADGTVEIHGVRYLPLHVTTRSDGSITVEAIDRVGGPWESRDLTVTMLGSFNVIGPEEPLELDPQCDPTWSPSHPLDGWIGGACEEASACGGVECLTELPGGLCTVACDRFCPDLLGHPATFCVDLGLGGGHCAAQCLSDASCRAGWVCRERPRVGDPSVVKLVCVPDAG